MSLSLSDVEYVVILNRKAFSTAVKIYNTTLVTCSRVQMSNIFGLPWDNLQAGHTLVNYSILLPDSQV